MAHRHKAHKKVIGSKPIGGHSEVAYSGGKSKVAKESHETAGGWKHGGKVPSHKSKHRMDKRARGGGVGKSPFSSAKMHEKGNETY